MLSWPDRPCVFSERAAAAGPRLRFPRCCRRQRQTATSAALSGPASRGARAGRGGLPPLSVCLCLSLFSVSLLSVSPLSLSLTLSLSSLFLSPFSLSLPALSLSLPLSLSLLSLSLSLSPSPSLPLPSLSRHNAVDSVPPDPRQPTVRRHTPRPRV